MLLGSPGSGKGTLATFLEDELGLPQLSTGELFRQEIQRKTRLGKTVSGFVTKGLLVPDEVVVKVMTRRLSASRSKRGFVLDGFPRTTGQAQGLDAYLARHRRPLHGAIVLVCSPGVLIARLGGRRVCGACGAIYHLRNLPPRRAGVCDRCGGKLGTRADDRIETIKKRLEVDRAQSKPLLDYYRRLGLLLRLNGDGSGLDVYRRARRLFARKSWVRETSRGRSGKPAPRGVRAAG